jgi:hypothetical protein
VGIFWLKRKSVTILTAFTTFLSHILTVWHGGIVTKCKIKVNHEFY